MPEHRGKRRTKRDRRRFGAQHSPTGGVLTDQSAAPATGARGQAKPIMRRSKPAPMWLNFAVGGAMLVLGLFFFFSVYTHNNIGERLLLLGAYCLLAGFYLFRGTRQYRSRRS